MAVEGAALEDRLHEALAQSGVPGATVGVFADGLTTVRSAGVARLPAGPPITDDTIFLTASITKIWTATLVLQLVDEGKVNLDAPINHYLEPKLRIEDEVARESVTVRQLLCHTGGFFGDAEEPQGENDDAVMRTVEAYDGLAQIHRPGRMLSYSNAGYNTLGRLIECLTEQTWDQAMQERLIGPLHLTSTFTRIQWAATHPLAVGHRPRSAEDLTLEPVETWNYWRGAGPCGGTLATNATDLLKFAQLHLNDGVAPDGTRLLSTESARLMREPHIKQHYSTEGAAWGLGWSIPRPEAPRMVEHTGNICGHDSVLIVVPDHQLAICVLTNGDLSNRLRQPLTTQLLSDIAGIVRPPAPAPGSGEHAPDPAHLVGTYERMPGVLVRVDNGADGLTLSVDPSNETGQWASAFTTPLVHVSGSTYLYRMPLLDKEITATFIFDNGAPATHIASGLRVAPRVSTP